ncbi:lipopolysaccharide export system protein LptA [Yoonia tamlensis]|uniref:Lipopolysaccharide export system protein LptA n=1 Tax=Yoonia tamlensis TaxID=390270 RepID=A0A1I6HK45_9RHOB|nr:lipopolysaccharide transport periplasmic protein LptA [Yoonia tamlensis]SFR54869.1 lipopolysaccharide export system protein LptA [Yoonia tamlensis]
MIRNLAILAAFLLSFGTAAVAQTNIDLGGMTVDTTAAIEVTADSLSVDQQTGTAVFTGNVIIGQGDLRLSANMVEVVYGSENSEIIRLNATGGVTFVTAAEAAEAQSAEYDITTGLLTLSGDVLLTQGASAISAQNMVVNVTTGSARMEGRVRTVLQQGGN